MARDRIAFEGIDFSWPRCPFSMNIRHSIWRGIMKSSWQPARNGNEPDCVSNAAFHNRNRFCPRSGRFCRRLSG